MKGYVKLRVFIEPRDPFTTLSTLNSSIEKSVFADAAFVCYEFQLGPVDSISWSPGNVNLAAPLFEKDFSFSIALESTMFTGTLTIILDSVV